MGSLWQGVGSGEAFVAENVIASKLDRQFRIVESRIGRLAEVLPAYRALSLVLLDVFDWHGLQAL
jgi:hypothetical protein